MKTKKILVVDDDDNIRKTFFLLLSKKYRVYPVKDSREALAMSRSAKVDLVIADYLLPHLNGMDLIKRLRETGFEGGAMLISAHPDLVKTDDLSRYAISHFFVKPLDLKDLDASIERVLRLKSLTEAAA